MKISYNWLKYSVPTLPPADTLEDVFTYKLCEVEEVEKVGDDTIFDINILPNRAHDLLSHLGVARELAGLLGLEFKDPSPSIYIPIPGGEETKLEIDIQTDKCRRYMGRIVRDVKVGSTVDWAKKLLESIGQKSINNIVDATNIGMFDCGQPMHAFDLKKIKGNKIVIRLAQEGETMTTLDGKDITLLESDMVIADEEGILALAGVKGGTKAEVDERTTDVLLEVANFDPVTVRKTARRLGILTDAAKRFENDLSPELAPYAMDELCSILKEDHPNAVYEQIVDVYPNPQEKRTLAFSLLKVNSLLGADISSDEAERILKNYSFMYTKNGDEFILDVPALRLDLVGTHDMAEELGRAYGYENITPVLPKIDFVLRANDTFVRTETARTKLLADGYSETMTYSFVKKGKVEVARGAKGKEFLRTNLSDGLKAAYEFNRLNAPLLGVDEIKLFEIGSVFPEKGTEIIHVAYADKKGVVESTLEEFTRETTLVTEITPPKKSSNMFVSWSQYPFITRDIAVWVPTGTSAEELIALCESHGKELLAHTPRVFDQFEKDGKVSLAVRMVFQSHEKTLTDEEISPIISSLTKAIEDKQWTVR